MSYIFSVVDYPHSKKTNSFIDRIYLVKEWISFRCLSRFYQNFVTENITYYMLSDNSGIDFSLLGGVSGDVSSVGVFERFKSVGVFERLNPRPAGLRKLESSGSAPSTDFNLVLEVVICLLMESRVIVLDLLPGGSGVPERAGEEDPLFELISLLLRNLSLNNGFVFSVFH